MVTWSLCRRLLSRGGALVSNAEVIRFLLETATPRIDEMRAEEAAREAERAAAAEREIAAAVVDENDEAQWAQGLQEEGRRRVPDRISDSQPAEPAEPAQPVPPNPNPSIASVVDTLPRYGFISAGKLFELFQTFQHYYPFMSSEFELYYGVPAVTTLMYLSALCAGLTYTQLDALYMEAGIARVSENQFMGFQSGGNRREGWIQVVLERWAEEKVDVHRQIKALYFPEDQPRRHFVVYADLRYDSSRNGFNGTCAFINRDDGRVIELVNIQRTETSNNSWLIEDKAFEAGLERLQAAGILPDEVVHNDKSSVDAILRRFGIVSQKDLWHKCKNVLKKFIADVQQKKRTATSVREANSIADLQMLTKAQLELWLREGGHRIGGNKADLVNRVASLRGFSMEENTANETGGRNQLLYPELSQHGIADKLKGWIYTCCQRHTEFHGPFIDDQGRPIEEDSSSSLICDIINAGNHWAGDHALCWVLPGNRPCCQPIEAGTERPQKYYEEGSPTHDAVIKFLEKHITPAKMRFYTRARENFLSETFHSVINKYATKRIHFHKSHEARLSACAMDWKRTLVVLRIAFCSVVHNIRTTQ
ncbi:hypothetical protein R1sor_019650 [Riccia sorocarpa]|uniref:SAP domain-containing protein n=1 Tax=Riccia sorocarpa TaxID=122646 RepID=A0ABD3ID94_9MARC